MLKISHGSPTGLHGSPMVKFWSSLVQSNVARFGLVWYGLVRSGPAGPVQCGPVQSPLV